MIYDKDGVFIDEVEFQDLKKDENKDLMKKKT